jgi:hypothetical protein
VAFSPTPASDDLTGSIWIARLDGNTPPRQLAGIQARRAVFGPGDSLYFVQGGLLYRIHADGSGRTQVIPDSMRILYDVSPDGKWAAAWTTGAAVALYPLDGGPAVELCPTCGTVGAENRGVTPLVVSWSRSGRFIYLHSAWTTRETYAVPLKPGQMLPPLPKGGFRSVQDITNLAGAQRLAQLRAFPGDDPSVFLFMRATSQRNIYRVPLP